MLNKIQVIQDTLDFYGEDTSRRAVTDYACCYQTEDGRRCAIGRLCGDKEIIPATQMVLTVFSQLPPEVQELGQFFLESLQKIHDVAVNWTHPRDAMLRAIEECLNTFFEEIPEDLSFFIGPFTEFGDIAILDEEAVQ